jgi:dTDP-4-dehydrorhamnose 3,5-epimerase
VSRTEALDIHGAWVFSPRIHVDRRGSFLEWFTDAEVRADLGHHMDIAQASCSVSRRGVIRGIHFSDVPPGQAKYVTCASGAIIDAVVDLRMGSPTFATWGAVRLDDENRWALYIGEGLGHAFAALTDQATVLYLCSTPHAPDREHGVNPLDPAIGIAWRTSSRSCPTGTPLPRPWRRRGRPASSRTTPNAKRRWPSSGRARRPRASSGAEPAPRECFTPLAPFARYCRQP